MTKQDSRRRKVLAILAGGAVLGVGAAITLAAWNDSEFATGTFTAGQFNLQGSSDNGDTDAFADNPAAPGEQITFSAGFDNMAPDDTVYAGFWVRLDGATTSSATLSATEAGTAGSGDNADHLSYTVYAIDAGDDCDATASTGTLIASGGDLNDFTQGGTVGLAVGAGADPGASVQLCFAVTAEDGLLQGETATGVWQFTAESQ